MKNVITILLIALFMNIVIYSSYSIAGASSAEKKQKMFTRQFIEVKKKYPAVAMEYLRREAFAHQIAQLVFAQSKFDQQNIAVAEASLCYLFRRFEIASPQQCNQVTNIRIGDIGSCFEPKPSSDGGYEMPSADEAEDCINEQMKPQGSP